MTSGLSMTWGVLAAAVVELETESLDAAAVQWAERIKRKTDGVYRRRNWTARSRPGCCEPINS